MASPGDMLAARVEDFLRSSTSTVRISALPEAAALALQQFADSQAETPLAAVASDNPPVASATGTSVPLQFAAAAVNAEVVSLEELMSGIALSLHGGAVPEHDVYAATICCLSQEWALASALPVLFSDDEEPSPVRSRAEGAWSSPPSHALPFAVI
jgi:hypothetical protein